MTWPCYNENHIIMRRVIRRLKCNKDNYNILGGFEFQLDLTSDCGVRCPGVFEKSLFCCVATLAPSILIGSSSYLKVTRIAITSRMSSNFSHFRPLTAELSALDRVKNQYLSVVATLRVCARIFFFFRHHFRQSDFFCAIFFNLEPNLSQTFGHFCQKIS